MGCTGRRRRLLIALPPPAFVHRTQRSGRRDRTGCVEPRCPIIRAGISRKPSAISDHVSDTMLCNHRRLARRSQRPATREVNPPARATRARPAIRRGRAIFKSTAPISPSWSRTGKAHAPRGRGVSALTCIYRCPPRPPVSWKSGFRLSLTGPPPQTSGRA
jgi:hypothetical protein